MNGFTLIELLVVVAIIAIICAIIFPVFHHASMAAQQRPRSIYVNGHRYHEDFRGDLIREDR
jgi:prepilin-type N-terminal cleavage/methylation domain-containing protein